MAYTDSTRGLFQGVLYIASRDFNGVQTSGFEDLGQVDMFSIDPKPKFEDITDSRISPAGTIDHMLTEIDFGVKMRALDIKMSTWARSVYGEWSGAVIAATSVTETITLYNGRMTALAHPGVTNVVIAGAAVDTDYTVNAAAGAINVKTTSPAAPDGTPLTTTVTYDHAAYNGKVEAFTIPQKYFALRLHGINVAQGGQPVIVNVRQWAPDPTKVLNFIDKKHYANEIDGKLLKDQLIDDPVPGSGDFSQYFSILKA